MSATVIYLPDAASDVDTAYEALEKRVVGLGERLLNRLQQRISAISNNPQMYAVVHDGVRAAPVRRFPYVVYYRFEAGVVFILAVIHAGRDPQVLDGPGLTGLLEFQLGVTGVPLWSNRWCSL